MNIHQTLKSAALFKDWSDDDLQKVAAISKHRHLSPGEMLFMEKEESSSFFVLASGSIAVRKSSQHGDDTLSTISAHSFFGEMGMLVHEGEATQPRTAATEAIEASQVVEIPYAGFRKVLADAPGLGKIFYRNVAISLAARIRRTTDDLTSLRALRLRHV